MEYQKIINLLDDTKNQLSKFRTGNWVEITDKSGGKYDNISIKFKLSMIKSNLCDYSDAYVLASGTIGIEGAEADYAVKQLDEINKAVAFKACAPFINV